MLTYSLSDTGTDSLYIYLYKCIKNDILNGIISPGTKLPSKRNFAKNLGVSNITVENAYSILQSEGYIYSIPKKGFYAADISAVSPFKQTLPQTFTSINTPKQMPVFFADFVNNKTISENFPFSIWARLMRDTISKNKEELMANPPCGGIMELRSAIAKHLKQFRNMSVSPEQIIIGAGTDYLYCLLIQLLGQDKIYAAENPGYDKIAKVYKSNNVQFKYINMDNFGINIKALTASNADIAHISPSHHYPSGIVTPINRRYELLNWAANSPSHYIIEDDYDSEFRFTAKPLPTLQSIDTMEKVIYINTFTKSLASTIRISYIVLPFHLLNRFYETLSFYSGTVSNFEQYTLARFINEGYFEKHINRMRKYYRDVRDCLLNCIYKSRLSPIITINEKESGLHFTIKLKTTLSDDVITERAYKLGIRISFISQYFHNKTEGSDHIIVMNYSGIKPENIKKAVELLAKACTD